MKKQKFMYSYHPSPFFSQIFQKLNILEEQSGNLLLALVFSSKFQFKEKRKSSSILIYIYLVAASLDWLPHIILPKLRVHFKTAWFGDWSFGSFKRT